jgi:hypothetical protein
LQDVDPRHLAAGLRTFIAEEKADLEAAALNPQAMA